MKNTYSVKTLEEEFEEILIGKDKDGSHTVFKYKNGSPRILAKIAALHYKPKEQKQ